MIHRGCFFSAEKEIAMKGFSTPHTRYPANPQTYWEHWKVAMSGSLKLSIYAISSVIHAFFPEIKRLQFHASSGIIRMYKSLEESGRHDREIEIIFSRNRREHITKNRGT